MVIAYHIITIKNMQKGRFRHYHYGNKNYGKREANVFLEGLLP